MAINLNYRRTALKGLTNAIGVYVLCDLDNVPLYVGQSVDGIRARVNRHLTSARSDIIANRQIDVWEIAWVRAFPVSDRATIGLVESTLFYKFDSLVPLMNGKAPPRPPTDFRIPEAAQIVQVMSDDEIREKLDPSLRLPRQAAHYSQIVGHFLAVKNSKEIARAMDSHFARLERYHRDLLGKAVDVEDGGDA